MRVFMPLVIVMVIVVGSTSLAQDLPMVGTTTSITQDDQIRLVIKNNHTSPLTAYAYEGSYISSGHPVSAVDIVDLLAAPQKSPIAPGLLAVASLGSKGMTDMQIYFRGAIFADGSTFGDTAWIQRIMQNRQYLFDEVTSVEQELRRAVAEGTDIDSLVDQIKSHRENRKASAERNDLDQLSAINRFWTEAMNAINSSRQRGYELSSFINAYLNKLEGLRTKLERSLPALNESSHPQ